MTDRPDREGLEGLARGDLVGEARRWGIRKPEVMTRVELVDEILRLSTPNPEERRKLRGWLGVARDLVASAVERGLHLPDAAAFIRGDVRYEPLAPPDRPIATVTLAEIYGAQGHHERALSTLDQVLAKEPEHEIARRLRERIVRDRDARKAKASAPPPAPAEAEVSERSSPAPELDPPTVPPPADPPTLPPAPDLPTLAPPPEDREPETHRRGAEVEADPPTNPRASAGLEGPGDEAVVFARTGPTSALAYFEVGPGVADAGALLRVIEWVPRGSSVDRLERRVRLSGRRGAVGIDGLEQGSVLRAALGIEHEGTFEVRAVAAEVRASSGEVVWAPRSGVDYGALAGRLALPSAM